MKFEWDVEKDLINKRKPINMSMMLMLRLCELSVQEKQPRTNKKPIRKGAQYETRI